MAYCQALSFHLYSKPLLLTVTLFIYFYQIEFIVCQVMPIPTEIMQVECGESYYVPDYGFLKFSLNKPERCDVAFLGSRRAGCTVEIMCPIFETHNKTKQKQCIPEFLKIRDYVGGRFTGCGIRNLNTPAKPTNKGVDLYLAFKGVAPQSYCQVFCGESKQHWVELKDKVSKELFPDKPRKFDSSCVCGEMKDQQGRIVGGTNAHEFQYPWLTPIVFSVADAEYNVSLRSPVCGGSLITDRHILTAAHCFVNTQLHHEDVHVLLHAHLMDLTFVTENTTKQQIEEIPGWNLPSKTDKDEDTVRTEISQVKVHPYYNPETYDFDVAILTLKEVRVNLQRKDLAGTICLPLEGQFSDITGKTIEVAGWGQVNEHNELSSRLLQKVQVPVIDWNQCNQVTNGFNTPRHMCAGFLGKGEKDSCKGDSGGPAIYKFNNNQWVQRGIVSTGVGCARPNHPGIYTDTEEVIQWIYYITRKGNGMWCKDSQNQVVEN